jgi:hypothetical protein
VRASGVISLPVKRIFMQTHEMAEAELGGEQDFALDSPAGTIPRLFSGKVRARKRGRGRASK